MRIIVKGLAKVYQFCQKHPVFVLILIFLGFASTLLANAWFNKNGYLTPDSMHYLKLAKSILHGEGFDRVLTLSSDGTNTQFFATWPVGYPVLIAALAWITTLNVFWASKVLACLSGAGILIIFHQLFGRTAWVYGLVLWFATFLELFSYSWSEVPFIFGLCLFILALTRYESRQTAFHLGLLFLAIMGLFLSRYVGGFVLLVLGFKLLYDFFKHKKWDWGLFSISCFAGLCCLLYCYHNYLEVGYFTGAPRVISKEPFSLLTGQLFEALLKELSLSLTRKFSWISIVLVSIGFQALAIYFLRKVYQEGHLPPIQFGQDGEKVWPQLLFVGGFYLAIIILLRFTLTFDDFNFRLLAPGSFLIFIGLINWIATEKKALYPALGIFMLVFGGLSFLLNHPVKLIYNENWDAKHFKDYPATLAEIEKKYSFIEPPALVAFGNQHLIYRKQEVYITEPLTNKETPQKGESKEAFLDRLKQFRGQVWIEIVDTSNKPYQYLHSSVRAFMRKNSQQDYVKFR